MRDNWQPSTRKHVPGVNTGDASTNVITETKKGRVTKRQYRSCSKTSTAACFDANVVPSLISPTPRMTPNHDSEESVENSQRCGKHCSKMRTSARLRKIPRSSLSFEPLRTAKMTKTSTSLTAQQRTPSALSPTLKKSPTPSLNNPNSLNHPSANVNAPFKTPFPTKQMCVHQQQPAVPPLLRNQPP